jgi:hypothetical protein
MRLLLSGFPDQTWKLHSGPPDREKCIREPGSTSSLETGCVFQHEDEAKVPEMAERLAALLSPPNPAG